jgi:Protein of unknwon function (DUF3008)
MPATTKAQQSAFGMALAAREGKIKPEELKGAASQLFRDKSLTNSQLKDYASTKRGDLPSKKTGTQIRPRWKRG